MAAATLLRPPNANPQATLSVSPRTQARTNIKIQNPTLWSKEKLVRATQPTPPAVEPALAARVQPTQVQQPELPARQDGGGGEPSFDSSEEFPLTAVQSKFWTALWGLSSVVVMTLLIPLSVLLLPYASGRTRGPCRGGQCPGSRSTATTENTLRGTAAGPIAWRMADFVEDIPRPSNLSCELQVRPDPRTSPLGPMATRPKFNPKHLVQYRHVLCHLDTQYWRSVSPYLGSLLPTSYCSVLVLSGYAVDAERNHVIWRPTSGKFYLDHFRRLRRKNQLKHNMENMAFFTTIGGRLEDSKNFSAVVESDVRRRAFVANTNASRDKALVEGVHLDWNYPGDACSSAADVTGFLMLLQHFRAANIPFIVSVPPIESRVQFYSLNETAQVAEFVIIKTHTLTLPGYVCCSGVRPIAARFFNKIRDQLNTTVWHKIGYSVSVGAETFTSKQAALWVPSSGPSSWDNYTLQPGKTHVTSVCNESVLCQDGFEECGFASRHIGSGIYHVATLHSETSMARRIKNSYDDGMGIAPIMAYDIDLDDFEGRCGRQKSSNVRSLAIAYF